MGHGPREPVGRVPPRLGARPLPDRHRADCGRRQGGGEPRASNYLFFRQQKPDGSFPQNSTVDGTPHWDQPPARRGGVPDRARVAARPGRTGALPRPHQEGGRLHRQLPGRALQRRRSGGRTRAATPRRRSPPRSRDSSARPTSPRKNGDTASATRYEQTADDWQPRVDGWTATTNGPYTPKPYYLRLTKDGDPNAGTTYNIGDSGPIGGPAKGRGPELPRARSAGHQERE